MKDLITALSIFLKYGNLPHPIHCEHDMFIVCGIDPNLVSSEDLLDLFNLGFFVEEGYFISYRFGSC